MADLELIETDEGSEWGKSVYLMGEKREKVVTVSLEDWEGFVQAAQKVVDSWEGHGLAEAVTELGMWLED